MGRAVADTPSPVTPAADESETLGGEKSPPSVDASEISSAKADTALEELVALVPPPVAEKKKRGRGRPPSNLTPEQRKARARRKEQEKKTRAKTLAALGGDLSLSSLSDAPAAAADAPANDAPAAAAEPVEADPQLAAMVGLGVDFVSRNWWPENAGGGALTADERKTLGDVWAIYLTPKIGGVMSPLMAACVTTVQVFAFRAMTNSMGIAPAGSPAAVSPAAAAPENVSATPAADAIPPAPVPQRTAPSTPADKRAPTGKRTPTRVGEAKTVKLPQYSGED